MGHVAGHPAMGEPLDDLQGPRGEPRQRVLAQHRSSWLAPPHPPSPAHDAVTAPAMALAPYALLKGGTSHVYRYHRGPADRRAARSCRPGQIPAPGTRPRGDLHGPADAGTR